MSASSRAQAVEVLRTVLAKAAGLDDSSWVKAAVIANASAFFVEATIWFPAGYNSIPSPFQNVSAFDYFVHMLKNVPDVVLMSSLVYLDSLLNGVKVTNLTVTLPGELPIDGITYATTASDASSTSSSSAPAIAVVSISAADLEVVTAAPQAGTPPAVDLSAVVDTNPPVITLLGSPYMSIIQFDSFTDPGATVYDNIDGNSVPLVRHVQLCNWPSGIQTAPANDSRPLTCFSELAMIDTTKPSEKSAAFVITYSAQDQANNTAIPLRRYVVVQERCPEPERWCWDVSACSVMRVCLRPVGTWSPGNQSVTAVYVPPVDKTAPKLMLLGTGLAAMTSTGAVVMMDNVTWKSSWTDHGAMAVDAVDGDLTASIQSYGAGAVDTSMPTPPGKDFGYVVEYYVEDKSKNAAPIARRLIRVVCPGTETHCIDPDTSAAICTVQINAGDVYDRCASDASISAVCERGVAAIDAKDGNMERQVLVCGSRWWAAVHQRAVPLLLACNITADTPGDYNLTFSVTNSAGLTSRVVRRLIIKAICPEGELLCPNKVTCSQGGSCAAVSAPSSSPSSGNNSVQNENGIAKSFGIRVLSHQPHDPANVAPKLQLVMVTGFGNVVAVRRGSSYGPCASGSTPTAEAPCEPGANATDPDGAAGPDSSAVRSPLDLTSEVVVCPPSQCLTKGCSLLELRKHYFTVKGLQGCGIDTSAAEGTKFTVDFWVWDSGAPALNGTVTRSVIISRPCQDSSAPYFCPDKFNQMFCSGVPCMKTDPLVIPAKPQPVIRLLPSSAAVYVQYGKPSPFYLGPCASGTSTASCGAVAWDVQPGKGQVDLTPYIAVTQIQDDCDPEQGQVCFTCNLNTLSGDGNCMPGSYTITYSVTNDEGRTEKAQRALVVYQSAEIHTFFALNSSLSLSEAQKLAEDVANSTSTAHAAAVQPVLSALSSTSGIQVDASDVVVTWASVNAESVDPRGYSVHAIKSLCHQSDIQEGATEFSLEKSPAAGGHSRRLLQSSSSQLQDSLSLLMSALNASGGFVVNSTSIGNSTLDLQAAYISALISSLQVLEQQLSYLNQTSIGLFSSFSTAYGAQEQQKEDQHTADVATSFQNLVSSFDAMVSVVSSLSDQALTRIDQQAAAAAAVSSSVSDAMTAMQESAVLMTRLQQTYLEQAVMLQDATGMTVTEWTYPSRHPSVLARAGGSFLLPATVQPLALRHPSAVNKRVRQLLRVDKGLRHLDHWGLMQLEASLPDISDVRPYGVDPTFLRSSALYRPELQAREGWYYNTSNPGEVSPATSTPFGFFYKSLQGYPDGYPVLLPVELSELRAGEALQYLQDGNYLDRKTSKALTAELLTYNADLKLFGYSQLTFIWQKDGTIAGEVYVRALPTVQAVVEGGGQEVALWLAPLGMLCLTFWLTVAWEAWEVLWRLKNNGSTFRILFTNGDQLMNIAIAILMVAAGVLLSAFRIQMILNIRPQPSYQMYDAISTAKARMFMPVKTYSEAAVSSGLARAAAAAAGGGDDSSVLETGQMPVSPGAAGRWLLPEAAGDWDSWANLMDSVHVMSGLWAAYTLLQGIIMILLILKLVRAWSFQSKLGIICNTLMKAAPQLAHLLIIIISCVALFSCLAIIGSGDRVQHYSSYGTAFEETLASLLGLGYVQKKDIFPGTVWQPFPQQLLSVLIFYGRELLFVLVLMQFFMSTLGSTFMKLKRSATGNKTSSIGQDVMHDVVPESRARLRGMFTRRPVTGSAASLQNFINNHGPHLLTSTTPGEQRTAIKISDKYLDLEVLQQLLVELSLDDDDSHLQLQQTGPAARYNRQVGMDPAAGSNSSATDAHVSAKTAQLQLLPPVGQAAVRAGCDGGAVAAALAAAAQLMDAFGETVDMAELHNVKMTLDTLADDLPRVEPSELEPGVDFTVEDIQAAVNHERHLHGQINAALWQAVAAMDRWSSAAAQYMMNITADTNSWLEQNAQLIAGLAGYGAPGTKFKPVPLPQQVVNKGLVRGRQDAQDRQQQEEATVDVTAQVRLQRKGVLGAEPGRGYSSSTSIRHVGVSVAEENTGSNGDRWANASMALNKASFKVHSSEASSSFTTVGSTSLHSRVQSMTASLQAANSAPASRRSSWSSIAADETRVAAAQGRWAASTMALKSQDSFGAMPSRQDNSPGSRSSHARSPSTIPGPQLLGQASSTAACKSRRSSRSVVPEWTSAFAAGAAQAVAASDAAASCTRSNSMLLEEADVDDHSSHAASVPTPWSRRRSTNSVVPVDDAEDPAGSFADSRSYRVTGSDVQIALSIKRKEQQ
eukprot:gene11535-11678_t